MKYVLALLIALTFSPVLAQNRFSNCVPGYIDLTIGGTFFKHVPMECGAISRKSELGYYPIGQIVSFEYNKANYAGVIAGYQFTWHPDQSISVQYMVQYQVSIGIAFQINEVAINADKVR